MIAGNGTGLLAETWLDGKEAGATKETFGSLHELGVRTFLHRPNKNENDWSFDPVQAARLGLADELKSSLLALTEKYQAYPSGMARFSGTAFYVEQIGEVADAL